MEENLFVVIYCIEETYRFGRELVVVLIDFEKTFDSAERVSLVRALKYYMCDPRLIEVVIDIYMGDTTEI